MRTNGRRKVSTLYKTAENDHAVQRLCYEVLLVMHSARSSRVSKNGRQEENGD